MRRRVRHLGDPVEGVRNRKFAVSWGTGIAQGIDAVIDRLSMEEFLELAQFVGELLGEVDGLREILGDVVQLPAFLWAVEVESLQADPWQSSVEARRHPAV